MTTTEIRISSTPEGAQRLANVTTKTNGNGVAPGRIPPWSNDMEESLLGAMLLNRDARALGIDLLTSAAFYKPAHGWIFDAMLTLHHQGGKVDPVTVAEVLRREGRTQTVCTKNGLLRLLADTPASANASHYAGVLAEMAACRNAIALADAVRDAGYRMEIEQLDELLAGGMDRVLATLGSRQGPPRPPVDLLDMLGSDERPPDFIVPGLLERGDRGIISGGEGGGKTTLFRQFGVQIAAGIHPFRLDEMPPRRVVHFDFQERQPQSEREYVKLRQRVDQRVGRGFLTVHHRRHGMNILNGGDRRWLRDGIGDAAAEVVVIGPIYRMFKAPKGASKHDEEVAEEVQLALDEISEELGGLVYLLEAHSPHGSMNDRAGWRPIGASAWIRWPEFGFGLRPLKVREGEVRSRGVGLVRFRQDRDRHRTWPGTLLYGNVWPWEADPAEIF